MFISTPHTALPQIRARITQKSKQLVSFTNVHLFSYKSFDCIHLELSHTLLTYKIDFHININGEESNVTELKIGHHMRHTELDVAWQLNAFLNSFEFSTDPMTLARPGLCSSSSNECVVWLSQKHCEEVQQWINFQIMLELNFRYLFVKS